MTPRRPAPWSTGHDPRLRRARQTRLKIRELRARAEKELGDLFDVRAFHDTVLGSGSLPLTALEAKVNGWIAETRKLAPSAP